jgi:serine kinase of HPr protein (carbohydrate metabolism regulator)
MSEPATVHASAVLVGEHGVLIKGAPGSGKSSLLLGLLASGPASTWLIADDRVILTNAHGRLVASVPAVLSGLLEIRGQGIVRRTFVSPAQLHLVVDLVPLAQCDRMPLPANDRITIEGVLLPLLSLPAGIGDGPVRIHAALASRLAPEDLRPSS